MPCLYSSGSNFTSVQLDKNENSRYTFNDSNKIRSNLLKTVSKSTFIQENDVICFIYCDTKKTYLLNISASNDESTEMLSHSFHQIAYEHPYLVVSNADKLFIYDLKLSTFIRDQPDNKPSSVLKSPIFERTFIHSISNENTRKSLASARINQLRLSNGRLLIGQENGIIHSASLKTLSFSQLKVQGIKHAGITALQFNPFKSFSSKACLGNSAGEVVYFDVFKNSQVQKFEPVIKKPVIDLSFSPVNNTLLIAITESTVSMFDIHKPREHKAMVTVETGKWFPEKLRWMKFVDERTLLTGCEKGLFAILYLDQINSNNVTTFRDNEWSNLTDIDFMFVERDIFIPENKENIPENRTKIQDFTPNKSRDPNSTQNSTIKANTSQQLPTLNNGATPVVPKLYQIEEERQDDMISDPNTPRDSSASMSFNSPNLRSPTPLNIIQESINNPHAGTILKKVLHKRSIPSNLTSTTPNRSVNFQSTPVPVKSRDFPGNIIEDLSESPIVRVPPSKKSHQNNQTYNKPPFQPKLARENSPSELPSCNNKCQTMITSLQTTVEKQSSKIDKLESNIDSMQRILSDILLGQKSLVSRFDEERELLKNNYLKDIRDGVEIAKDLGRTTQEIVQKQHKSVLDGIQQHHDIMIQHVDQSQYNQELQDQVQQYSMLYKHN